MHAEHDDHPMHWSWAPEDPMALNATPVQGDPAVMLDGLIEEYARQGWNETMIAPLFTSPAYRATYRLTQIFGEEHVRQRIRDTLLRTGTMRFNVTCHEEGPGERSGSFPV